MKYLVSQLKLCYPPISNQEAEWLKNAPDIQDYFKHSNLYMICQRHEATFEFKNTIEEILKQGKINFFFMCNGESDEVSLDLNEAFARRNVDLDIVDIDIELGPKLIRLWSMDKETKKRLDVIEWFTTEKLLYDKSIGHSSIMFFDNYRHFFQYYLHYVGISKKDDSLTRLVIKPHDKRLRVLSNEDVAKKGSRLTDEIILLFFRIERLEIKAYDYSAEEDVEDMLKPIVDDEIAIYSDAEKAFIKILDANYNEIKYANYPKGADGLYNAGLLRYGYIINERLSLFTDKQKMRGGNIFEGEPMDMIMINGDKVTFVSGETE